jgi:hypothetical protein
MEQRFKDRSEETTNNFLCYAIPNRRNAEGTELRIILGNENPTKGFGLERTLFKILYQRLEIVLKIGLKHFDANLVDTCGPPIALNRLESGMHQIGSDSSG